MAEGRFRTADRVTGALQSIGKSLKQISHHSGYGGVILSGELSRLAIELWGDGYGDVSDVSHGLAFLAVQGCPRL
jgi:hypothetical protein